MSKLPSFGTQATLLEVLGSLATVASWTSSTKRKYRVAIVRYETYLQKSAALGDVTGESLEAFQQWLQEQGGSTKYARDLVGCIKHVVNRAAPGKLPHGNADRAIYQNAESIGTIEHYLRHHYFPAKTKIANKQTEKLYGYAVSRFSRFLGRPATLEDLSDLTVGQFLRSMRDEDIAPRTANGYYAKLRAFWVWCANRRLIEDFPTLDRLPEPVKIPRCWSLEELHQLFEACDRMPGWIEGIPAHRWWRGVHMVAWDTGERAGAVFALRWEWFNPATGELEAPAEIRKGGQKPMLYHLKPATVALLESIREPRRELIFPWIKSESTFHSEYRKLLELAELPYELRKSGLQKMRRTFASHVEANGGNATAALDHTARKVTTQSYLDPRIAQQQPANAVLPELPAKAEQQPASRSLFARLFSSRRQKGDS